MPLLTAPDTSAHLLPELSGEQLRMLSPSCHELLRKLNQLGLLNAAEQQQFLIDRAEHLREYHTEERLGQALVTSGLLTHYQLQRILSGQTRGLVLGNYRVLEELGRGGMGTVYLAEHRLMKRRVAIKVLPVDEDVHPSVKQRFYSEMRVLSELSHPNIVLALDAGELNDEPGMPPVIYLVMELIEGGDLEQQVIRSGVLSVQQASNYIRQAASALQAAHDRHLIHRDIKPSNLLLTASNQIKLVDFGLARQFSSRLTDQRALLGSVEFMPPEQSYDPSLVGKEADIYSLGATFFWLLTGEGPYPYMPHVGRALHLLQTDPPRRLRELRPDVPEELDRLVARMLERNPDNRPRSPLAVVNALRPFAMPESGLGNGKLQTWFPQPSWDGSQRCRVLIVDDEVQICLFNRLVLQQLGCECYEVHDGQSALQAIEELTFDLILLDLNLPDMAGYELCQRVREQQDNPHLKIIVVSGMADQNGLSEALLRGADDYIPKPYEQKQLLAKVRHALMLKSAQDRVAHLAEELLAVNEQLEQSLKARNADLRDAHNALLFTMAKIAESRDGETPGHLRRMQLYCRVLAICVSRHEPWKGLVDERFLEQLERCVPLHDIGKIGLPDDILLKPAALSPTERSIVETHPVIGDTILAALSKEYGSALDFLSMARVIVRHHHERFDGQGYPDRLIGDAIPPAARLVAVADVYDALRRRRLYKPAMGHLAAIQLMVDRSEGQFDPVLMDALSRCHGEFERIYRSIDE